MINKTLDFFFFSLPDLATKVMHSLFKSEFMGSSRSLGVAAYMLLYWKMGMSWTTP